MSCYDHVREQKRKIKKQKHEKMNEMTESWNERELKKSIWKYKSGKEKESKNCRNCECYKLIRDGQMTCEMRINCFLHLIRMYAQANIKRNEHWTLWACLSIETTPIMSICSI